MPSALECFCKITKLGNTVPKPQKEFSHGILLQLWRNHSLQKESKTVRKKQVVDAAEVECVQRCVTWLDLYPNC